MEAKCDGCAEYFAPSELGVYHDGTCWCQDCFKGGVAPRPARPILINYMFSWVEICGLIAYLDGNRDLDVLDTVDDLKKSLDYETFKVLKRVLKKDENGQIQEPDP